MIRNHLIEANETLIPVIYMGSIQRAFASESPFFGKAMTGAEALEKLAEDEIIKVLRLDTKTWATSDITEECAGLYLEDFTNRHGDVELTDEHSFPVFVKTSTAWARRKDDLEAQAPVRRDDVDIMPTFQRRVYSAISASR